MMVAGEANPGGDGLPPPSPTTLSNLKPELGTSIKYSIMTRPQGTGTTGRRIPLLANHFKVSVKDPNAIFYQYSVHMTYEDETVVPPGTGIGRKMLDRLYQTYSLELGGTKFAYDGEKSLYTVGPLPQQKLNFTVVLEESFSSETGSPGRTEKRLKQSIQSKTINVEISYAAKIPLKPVALPFKDADAEIAQDAHRVLDIVLRQQAAKRGCLLVRQSFFHDNSKDIKEIEGGLRTVQGFHSSFRPTQCGLSLNMDVSTTVILKPGSVIEFLKANQDVKEARYIDWKKAKRMLKSMRIKTTHSNMEFKITGLSEKPCHELYFPLKSKGDDGTNEGGTVDISVYEYFTKHRGIELTTSAYLPCIDVGKAKRPNYLPMELCSLVSLQRYKKELSLDQRAAIIGNSRKKPHERIESVTNAVKNNDYDDDPVLAACGISIQKHLTQLEGRVLEAPKLKVGNSHDCIPSNGKWNFNGKTFLKPEPIEKWVIVNFFASCDISDISRKLLDCGRQKGIRIERPYTLLEEELQFRRQSPIVRVEKMFEQIQVKLPGPPDFILCVLPERKTSDIYGPWKKKCLVDFGIVTQCISPTKKISDQYLTNVLLKINSKLGGINSLLAAEHSGLVPRIKDAPTMILGMDVCHGPPGRSDIPSVAAVVGSLEWPLISRYRAAIRTQKIPKGEMIDSLYTPLENGEDDGIMRELLKDFYLTSKKRKPTQIIIFRDGVSESQFNQVLNEELNQIIKAYKHLGEVDVPKFTVIVAQKNHNTKLFQTGSAQDNVPPGTVVDSDIVHPRNFDFYMCAQKGLIGTSRPAHYHVLLDEIGFSADELQNLVHSLSYVYQRSTSAVSIVAPICYAHLAAAQVMQFIKFDDLSEISSSSVTTSDSIPVPELPRLHENVRSSMFFC